MDIEEKPTLVRWSELPSPVLVNIYSFLGRKDQSSMSQVCKNWSREYSCPSLWREITFYITNREPTTDMHPAVRSAQRYGRFIHHVRIVAGELVAESLVYRQLELFFQALAYHSQLLSISFVYIEFFFMYNERFWISCKSVIDLLLTQNELQSLEFQNCRFTGREGVEIIQAIFNRNCKNLKKLVLRRMYDEFWGMNSRDIITDVSLAFETLMDLQSLTIDYSFFFENLFKSIYKYGSELKEQKTGNLKTLVLFCFFDLSTPYWGIAPEAWKYFKQIFPALEMDVSVEVQSGQEMAGYILRDIPASSLFLKYSFDTQLGIILRELKQGSIYENLEFLHLEVQEAENFAQDLLDFLKFDSKLRKLKLDFETFVEGLNDVFEYWLIDVPVSLKSVHITVYQNFHSNSQVSVYRNIFDNYAPSLRMEGLHLILSVI